MKKKFRIVECFTIFDGYFYEVQELRLGWFFERWETMESFRTKDLADKFLWEQTLN